jgi:hypothetical protein
MAALVLQDTVELRVMVLQMLAVVVVVQGLQTALLANKVLLTEALVVQE